ncbi:MAG TPA: hypothetical protein RMH99_25265 [Sandaracinaceae bacterium LLY-WYZ-13_1]|nr:hypothetical protein [Sandaracinaceae bacterium LLY-WYZ-13_1]
MSETAREPSLAELEALDVAHARFNAERSLRRAGPELEVRRVGGPSPRTARPGPTCDGRPCCGREEAARRGLSWVATDTAPAGSSLRNALRAGFWRRTTVVTFARSRSRGASLSPYDGPTNCAGAGRP